MLDFDCIYQNRQLMIDCLHALHNHNIMTHTVPNFLFKCHFCIEYILHRNYNGCVHQIFILYYICQINYSDHMSYWNKFQRRNEKKRKLLCDCMPHMMIENQIYNIDRNAKKIWRILQRICDSRLNIRFYFAIT